MQAGPYAYGRFLVDVGSRRFSVAGPLFFALQGLLVLAGSHARGVAFDRFLMPFCPFFAPLPLLDAHSRLAPFYLTKAAAQLLLVSLPMFLPMQSAAQAAQWWLPVGTVAASCAMVPLLVVARAFRAAQTGAIPKKQAAEAVRRCRQDSSVQVLDPATTFARSCPFWQHKMAEQFLSVVHGLHVGQLPAREEVDDGDSIAIDMSNDVSEWWGTPAVEGVPIWPTSNGLIFHTAALFPVMRNLVHCSMKAANHITDADLVVVMGALGNLKRWHLDLRNNSSITDMGLEKSARAVPGLTHWHLDLLTKS